MLISLSIINVALIESVKIDFTKGLNVLSGETGSGKSVILESLNFVLGAKADKTLIRSGEKQCKVSAEFDVSDNQNIKEVFIELGIDYDDTLIISRTFDIDGKSAIRLNGEVITASMLKKITSSLVDVHGQSEHFNLLKTSNQLKLLDKFGEIEISSVKEKISNNLNKYNKVIDELNNFGGDEKTRQYRLDILSYQINEISNCDIKDGEEENLTSIKQKLLYQEKISNALQFVKQAFTNENGINDLLQKSSKNISTISNISNDYNSLFERIENIYSESEDISDTACNLLDNFDESEYDINAIESRLEQIKTLKKKYGDSYSDICCFLDKAIEEKDKLENFNFLAEKLLKEKDLLEKDLYNDYISLSDLRKKYAKDFSEKVLKELSSLGMNKAQFAIDFNERPIIENCKFDSINGFDDICFSFSANMGEPLKPLSMVISGGEMSRFMLSIKAQSAKYNDISTFVFDEIDAGISGNVASIVAKKFADISKNVQVIAITHLPQISAMADNNLLIKKIESSNKTITEVNKLSYDGKIEEISRLVGGSGENTSAINLAKELIFNADEYKKSII